MLLFLSWCHLFFFRFVLLAFARHEKKKKDTLSMLSYHSNSMSNPTKQVLYQRYPSMKRLLIIVVSYITILQVLYEVQTVLVSIPCLAMITSIFLLILPQMLSSVVLKPISLDPPTGSNTKTNTTHERDLQNLLIQQTEQVLRTNLQQFHRV